MSRRVLITIYPLLLLVSAFGQALPRLSIADVTVSEIECSSQVAVFTVSVSPPYGKDASVEYATANRSAIAGADYTAVSGTLNFRRGSKEPQTISVPIADVLIPGSAKSFVITLMNPVNAELIKSQATGTIVPPRVAKCQSCALSCDDGNACTADACDAARGCVHVNASAVATPYCQLSSSGANFAVCNANGSWVDSDGDGLSDAAETQGYLDVNGNGVYDAGIDIPLPDADPRQPDVYLHYDYASGNGHDHNPPAEAIQYVVDALAAHGVRLHIDPQHNALCENQGDTGCLTVGAGAKVVTLGSPGSGAVDPVCAGPNAVSMQELRDALPYLRLIKPVYHYMVFGHYATCPDAEHCSQCPADPENPACVQPSQPPAAANLGTAEIFGNDAIVATQPFVDVASVASVSAIPLSAWGGLAMHELGHNLGLLHGGSDCFNNKPNYVSVMNYRFYTEGIPVGTSPGATDPKSCLTDVDCSSVHAVGAHCSSFTHTCFRIDYSDRVIGSLDPGNPGLVGLNETNLNETVGLSGGLGSDTDISWRHQVRPGSRYVRIPTNGSPIDWNDDGLIGTNVIFDVNGDGAANLLMGQNDWATAPINGVDQFTNLRFSFQCQPTFTGALITPRRASFPIVRSSGSNFEQLFQEYCRAQQNLLAYWSANRGVWAKAPMCEAPVRKSAMSRESRSKSAGEVKCHENR